jgi:hypothetical protein
VLQKGYNLDSFVWSSQPPVEVTDEFPSGRYTVYYYEGENDFVGHDVYEYLTNEKTPTEIANRLANIQVGDATLRSALIKISKQLDEILNILKID